MKDISKKALAVESLFEDYATSPVPEESRFGWLSQGMVWSGGAFCMTLFSIGGMLASAMDLFSFVLAAFLGSAILTILGSLIGIIGSRTHMASAFNSRFTLGVAGGRLFGFLLAVSLFGWFGYQCYVFADSTLSALTLFGFFGGSRIVWTIGGGLLMMITAVVGFGGITLIANLSVPLLFGLTLIAAGIIAGNVDVSVLQAASSQTAGRMSLSDGIVLVVGSLISGACIVSDISRFSKKSRDAVGGCVLGFLIAFPLVLLLGGFFYYACGTSDLCDLLVTRCGMGMFVPFVLVISMWTTNDYNLYCSVLGISNALDDYIKLPRWLLTLIVGIVSILLGAFGIMAVFSSFLNLLGVLIPPIAAVIIADYYLYNQNSGLYDYENVDKLKNFRGNTCLSAIAGMLTGLLCNYADIGFLRALCARIPACIVAMLASVIALVICNIVTHLWKTGKQETL